MTIYKSFDINEAGDPPPWGSKENQAFKDIIDTLVGDSLSQAKATSGHKHTKIYNGYSNVVVDANNSSNNVYLGGDPSVQPGNNFRFSMKNSFTIEGNLLPGEHTDILSIESDSIAYNNFIKLGEDGTHRVSVSLLDGYADAFRVKVGSDDAINVSSATGERTTFIGAAGVEFPLTLTSNGDAYTRIWSDISSKCTFLGFLSLSVDNRVWMRQIGGLVFIQLYVEGTSDNSFTSIKFPFVMQGNCKFCSLFGSDTSGNYSVVGSYTDGSDTLYTENYLGTTVFWQSSGIKSLSGSFIVSVDNPQFLL